MATTKDERKCFCCEKIYHYCGHGCKDDNPNEPWRFLFHDENCKKVYELWQAYRGKEITEDSLREKLNSMNIKAILASNSMISQDFKKILDEKKEVKKAPVTKKKKDDDLLVHQIVNK